MSLRRVERVKSKYQSFELWKSDRQVEFRVAGAIHSWWHRDRLLTGLAWDNIVAACLLRPDGPPESLLMLGLAGGTSLRVLRHLLPDCRFTAVEIDGKIVEVAKSEMELGRLGIELVIDDAHEWLGRQGRKFDVVVDDAYLAGSEDVFRPAAWGPQTIRKLEGATSSHGLLVANLMTGQGHRTAQSRARRVFRDRFPVVRSVSTPAAYGETLVGGCEVETGAALKQWEACFTNRLDRKLWRRLRVRKLSA